MKQLAPLYIILLSLLALRGFASDKNYERLKKRIPITNENRLVVNVSYGNGFFRLDKASSGNVFESEVVYQNSRPEIVYEMVGDEGRLRVSFDGKMSKSFRGDESLNIHSFKKLYDNEFYLSLTPQLPMDLTLELGVVKGELDLSGLQISSLDLEIGVSQANVTFDRPNPVSMRRCSIEGGVGKLEVGNLGNANIEDFVFQGGVGSYVLDFGGEYRQNTHARIEVGMGKLRLYLPEYIGTRIKLNKSFLSSCSIDHVYKDGNNYYNDNWQKTPVQLDMEIDAGIGKINVIWVGKE